ncbi:F0F1 ATP synthase subunit alpha, partial [bacterium]|nr:F0F1 ATP synthase subunit alpha [bacterium]
MDINKDFIVEQLKKQIADYKAETKEEVVGKVIEIGDGIAKVSGLDDVMMSEMLEFENENGDKVNGVALNLEEAEVGTMILGDHKSIKEGDKVK